MALITLNYNKVGTTTFTVQPGVTTLDAHAWGAGGGGGGRVVAGGAGGGAGGVYSWQRFSVTEGTTMPVVVATPGAASTANGSSGVFSWFGNTGSTGLVAMGGAGGITTSGAIGNTLGSIGISYYVGGNGANPGASFSGAGGAGAARFSVGQNAVGISQGIGASFGGGSGGRGSSQIRAGLGGTQAGGGGGGGFRTTATNRAGGIGGNGRILLEYITPPLSALTDNFDDNSFNTLKWIRTNDTQVVETNSQLRMSTIAAGNYVTFNSGISQMYDFTGSYAQIQVVDIGDSLTSYEAYPLQVLLNSSNYYAIDIINGFVNYSRTIASGTTILATETYNSITHSWIKIGESGGTVYFQKSYNGINWGNAAGSTRSFGITNTYIELSIGTYAAEATGTTLILDNFNILQSEPELVTAIRRSFVCS